MSTVVAKANSTSTSADPQVRGTHYLSLHKHLNKMPISVRLELMKGCLLGYAGMLGLLGSNDQIAESEDSLAVHLSRYLDSTVGRRLLASEVTHLKSQLRYPHMSNMFLGLELPSISKLCLDSKEQSHLLFLRGLAGVGSVPMEFRLPSVPAAWYKPARKLPTSRENTCSVNLRFDLSESVLDAHLKATTLVASGGRSHHLLVGDAVDFKGVSWSIVLWSFPPKRQLLVGVRPTFNLRDSSAAQLAGIYAECDCRLDSATPVVSGSRRAAWIGHAGSATDNFVQVKGGRPGNPLQLEWWKDYVVDGFVRFSATVTIL